LNIARIRAHLFWHRHVEWRLTFLNNKLNKLFYRYVILRQDASCCFTMPHLASIYFIREELNPDKDEASSAEQEGNPAGVNDLAGQSKD
jgi:hypothetical protein